jgi:hypothetical protein
MSRGTHNVLRSSRGSPGGNQYLPSRPYGPKQFAPDQLMKGLGSEIDSIPMPSDAGQSSPVSIQDLKAVASYSWLAASTATIVVPGTYPVLNLYCSANPVFLVRRPPSVAGTWAAVCCPSRYRNCLYRSECCSTFFLAPSPSYRGCVSICTKVLSAIRRFYNRSKRTPQAMSLGHRGSQGGHI